METIVTHFIFTSRVTMIHKDIITIKTNIPAYLGGNIPKVFAVRSAAITKFQSSLTSYCEHLLSTLILAYPPFDLVSNL